MFMFSNIKLILLDRDGVINEESDAFIRAVEEWKPLPGSLEAIVRLQAQFKVAVCTNQSGVGRGYLNEHQLADIHDRLNRHLISLGGSALDIFFCPHLPDAQCTCRKPAPGLLIAAMQAYGVSASKTVFVGDSPRDLEASLAAGSQPALVLTGNGSRTAATLDPSIPVYDNLKALADSIVS